MVRAWLMSSVEDQRLECRREPNEDVTLDELAQLGVQYAYIPVEKRGELLEQFAQDKGYDYHDEIVINKDKLVNYDEKVRIFFEEHLHDDDEVRYVIDGSGYFDVRDRQDQWIRIEVGPGDLLVLPAGIYHRFSVDTHDYIFVRRLFHGVPVWTPFNRPVDDMPVRQGYVQQYLVSQQ